MRCSTTNRLVVAALSAVGLVSAASAQLPPPPSEAPARPSAPVRPTPGNPAARQQQFTQESQGALVFEQRRHNFGRIFEHERAETAFRFRNEGTEPLTILDIKSPCGCTVPELAKTVYAPGEEGELKVYFDAKNREGAQTKTIQITTDSVRTPNTSVTFTADVFVLVRAEPSRVNFGRVEKSENPERLLKISGRTDDFEAFLEPEMSEDFPFVVEKIGTEPTVNALGEQLRTTTFKVTRRPGLPVGGRSGLLRILTNDDRVPQLDVDMRIYLVGDLAARPARVNFGRMEIGDSFEQTFQVVSKTAAPFELTGVKALGALADASFTYEPVDPEARDIWTVTLTGRANDTAPMTGTIRLETNLEDEQEVIVPFFGLVNGAPQPRVINPSAGTTGR